MLPGNVPRIVVISHQRATNGKLLWRFTISVMALKRRIACSLSPPSVVIACKLHYS